MGDDDLESRQWMRAVAELTSDVVFATTPERRVRWVSPSVTQVLGWQPEELVGSEPVTLLHPDDQAVTQPVRERLYTGAEEVDHQARTVVRIRCRDGSYRWMSTISTRRMDAGGESAGLVVALKDVNDLVTARLDAQAREQRLRATLDSFLDPCIVLEAVRNDSGTVVDFRYRDANDAAIAYNQATRDDLIGKRLLELFPGQASAGLIPVYARTVDTGEPLILDDQGYDNEVLGDERRYDVRGARSGDSIVLSWRDVTDRHVTQERLARSEEMYRLATEGLWDAVVRWDHTGRILWVSPSFTALTGFDADEVVGKDAFEALTEESVLAARAVQAELASGRLLDQSVVQIRCADGSLKWIRLRSRPFRRDDGAPNPEQDGYVSVLRDVQEEMDARIRLDQEIGRDPLTGLATWALVKARVDAALAEQPRAVAVLCVGVDRLKRVNEAVSYAGGDAVLRAVAERIVSAAGGPELVGRVGGDEFVVLVPGLNLAADAGPAAARIRGGVQGPVTVGGRDLLPTVSVGVAVSDGHSTPDDLLRHASLAMHAAKVSGRDQIAFADPAVAAQAELRLQVEVDLRAALGGHRVVAWYQPIVSLRDNLLVGYEALARWQADTDSVRQPVEFMDVAERSGLIRAVDFAVLDRVLRTAESFPGHAWFAVNVSSATLASPGYADTVAELVTAGGVDPSRLHLEVTETMLLRAAGDLPAAMGRLADLGVRWYVDDFGTGFSSMSHLRDLPIHGLKLDMSFTHKLADGHSSALRLAGGLAGLAAGLGLDTVAEGVETSRQAEILRGQGWDKGQGMWFGAPAPHAAAAGS